MSIASVFRRKMFQTDPRFGSRFGLKNTEKPTAYFGADETLHRRLKETHVAMYAQVLSCLQAEWDFWVAVLHSKAATSLGVRAALQRLRYLREELGVKQSEFKKIRAFGVRQIHLARTKALIARAGMKDGVYGRYEKIRRGIRSAKPRLKLKELGISAQQLRDLQGT